ncbi:MAG: PilZ domain-containing protein [Candidatus Caenarcaniphilales bacterium]|nr:PilZ domain-containing protein [Candidatus Caenarcaniphilales bacterium]
MKREFDRALFWVKIETPGSKFGFLPGELTIDESNQITLRSPRANRNSFIKLFPSKPLPIDTIVSLVFQDKQLFELWSCEITTYLGSKDGYDIYELSSIKQEMTSSERREERFNVDIPITLESNKSKLGKVFKFSGCELNMNGIGLWLPSFVKNRIRLDEEFTLTFEPKEVEHFSVTVKCIRPHSEDYISKGFYAGFEIIKDSMEENKLAFIRIKQLLEARGRMHKPNLSLPGHYLSTFWQGEFIKELC